MTKLAFLIRSLNLGGAERQLVTLIKELNKEIFQITILYFYPGGELEQELKDTEVQTICLEKRERWDLLGFVWRLYDRLRYIQPDVIHGYLGTANLLTIILKPFFPSTRIIWGVRASNVDFNRYDWMIGLIFKLECLFSRWADLIIVNSSAGRGYHLAHGFPDEKMIVIPNGIDTDRFKPDIASRARVRAEWGIAEDIILIGLVGRLDPMKDHPTFLRAAALLCQQRQDVRFVCVGSGSQSYAQKLYQLADDLKIGEKVIWAGGRADMQTVYNAIDIASSSSSYGEGFPNVVGEAMACGIPCVVTDVGDSGWIVDDTGIVVQPKNPEALAGGWAACMERDRSVMGGKARSRIVHKFGINQLVKQTEKVIKEV